ncbi:MAG TPA: DinB family protein [Gemmatimonadales bacterium]|jgi:hypothetical protein
MDDNLPSWSVRLLREVDANDAQAQRIAGSLTLEQLNWNPRPDAWSAGQCLEHLCGTTQHYLPRIEEALRNQPNGRVEEITPGGPSRWFIRTMIDPATSTKRFSAPGKIVPGSRVDAGIIQRFRDANQRLRATIRQAANYDVNRIRFRNPFLSIIRFTVGSGLVILSSHERRHLLQAERAAAAFPAQAPPSKR